MPNRSLPNVTYKVFDAKAVIGLEVIVWDSDHAEIGWTPVRELEQVQGTVLFEDNPRVARDLQAWFDAMFMESVEYSEWEGQLQADKGGTT